MRQRERAQHDERRPALRSPDAQRLVSTPRTRRRLLLLPWRISVASAPMGARPTLPVPGPNRSAPGRARRGGALSGLWQGDVAVLRSRRTFVRDCSGSNAERGPDMGARSDDEVRAMSYAMLSRTRGTTSGRACRRHTSGDHRGADKGQLLNRANHGEGGWLVGRGLRIIGHLIQLVRSAVAQLSSSVDQTDPTRSATAWQVVLGVPR